MPSGVCSNITYMAKGSGGTRIKYPSKEHSDAENQAYKAKLALQYGEGWEITAADALSSGYVATENKRIEDAQKSPNEREKYAKEKGMCVDLAFMGFQIEHLAETPGVSSADTKIVRAPINCRVKMNGEYADLKALSSANNIVRHGKDAIQKQNAEKVVFKFPDTIDRIKMHKELNKLVSKNIHGVFYFEGHNGYQTF